MKENSKLTIIPEDEEPHSWWAEWYTDVADGVLEHHTPEELYHATQQRYLEMRKKGYSLKRILGELSIPVPKKTIPRWEAQCPLPGDAKDWARALERKFVLVDEAGRTRAQLRMWSSVCPTILLYDEEGEVYAYASGQEQEQAFLVDGKDGLVRMRLREQDEGAETVRVRKHCTVRAPLSSARTISCILAHHDDYEPSRVFYINEAGVVVGGSYTTFVVLSNMRGDSFREGEKIGGKKEKFDTRPTRIALYDEQGNARIIIGEEKGFESVRFNDCGHSLRAVFTDHRGDERAILGYKRGEPVLDVMLP